MIPLTIPTLHGIARPADGGIKPAAPILTLTAGEEMFTVTATTTASYYWINAWRYRYAEIPDNSTTFKECESSPWIYIDDEDTSNTQDITFVVSNLTNDTQYGIQVQATNYSVSHGNPDAGWSELSGNGLCLPVTPRIDLPTEPALTALPGDGQVTLHADVIASEVTLWQYRQKTGNTGYGAWTDIVGTTASLTHTVTNLTNGIVHRFKVRAVNSRGNGPESSEVIIIPGTPSKPELVADPGDTSATLSASITNTNGSDITKWQYQEVDTSIDYTPWIDIAHTAATSMTYTITGLTNGIAYTFRVRAVNSRGGGVPSDAVIVIPGTPTRPALTAYPGNTAAVLMASVASTNGSDITMWQYRQRSGTADYGTWTDIADTDLSIPHAITDSAMSMTHTVTGLTNGTVYTFQVRAVNDRGNSPDSNESTVIPGVPVKPVLTAAPHDTSATLSASVASTNGSDITMWQYAQKTGADDYGAWSDIASTAMSMTHTVTGLTNTTVYTFKVRAVNTHGSSPDSDGVDVTPATIPSEPTLSAAPAHEAAVLSASVASSNGSDIIKWQYAQKVGPDDYGAWSDIVSTGTSATQTDTSAAQTDTSMTHTVTGLTNGTVYTFKVRAVNGQGNSPDSNEITVMPVNVPSEPTLSAVSGDEAAVLSASVASSNGSDIIKWQYAQKVGVDDYGAWSDIVSTETSATQTDTSAVQTDTSAVQTDTSATQTDTSMTKTDTSATWTDTSMTHTVTGLTNGTIYTFKVRAVNGRGDSPDSNEVPLIPDLAPQCLSRRRRPHRHRHRHRTLRA